jgi:hypothetical protein
VARDEEAVGRAARVLLEELAEAGGYWLDHLPGGGEEACVAVVAGVVLLRCVLVTCGLFVKFIGN